MYCEGCEIKYKYLRGAGHLKGWEQLLYMMIEYKYKSVNNFIFSCKALN